MTEFVEVLPPHGNTNPEVAQYLADLAANPGKWAAYPRPLRPGSTAPAAGRYRKKGYETTVRGGVLYMRVPA